MDAKQFNELTEKYANEHLIPLGFKKKGVHYYLYRSPNLMLFCKDTFRGSFTGFYIALTHDFLSSRGTQNEKLAVPVSLESYPVSISLQELRQQYSQHESILDFTYDLNFMTRCILTTRHRSKFNSFDILNFAKIHENDNRAEEYIKSSFDILTKEGMMFFNNFSPMVSYKAVTKFEGTEDQTIERFKSELEHYFKDNNIQLERPKTSWFRKYFR